MLLVGHIVVAILGLVLSTYNFFKPSKTNLYLTYAAVMITLSSGYYLVWRSRSPLLPACVSGLFYLGSIAMLMAFSAYKLRRQEM